MKINEVEKQIDISRRSIRFYEQEGLLHPQRNKENGYRNYSQTDVDTLLKIKFLRKLALPIEEIRMLQEKRLTLQDALQRHLITLEHEEKNLREICDLCRLLTREALCYETFDASARLAQMEKMEQEGIRFMNVGKEDKKKKRHSMWAGMSFIALMVFVEILMIWAFFAAPEGAPPLAIMIFLWLLPLAVIGCVVAVIKERMKEIEGGEEDEAGKY